MTTTTTTTTTTDDDEAPLASVSSVVGRLSLSSVSLSSSSVPLSWSSSFVVVLVDLTTGGSGGNANDVQHLMAAGSDWQPVGRGATVGRKARATRALCVGDALAGLPAD
jgi:hypothetical protein